MTIISADRANGFAHPALFYATDEEYCAGLAPFVTDGLSRGEPVAAAVPGHRLTVLRDALGRDAARVHFVDMAEAGRNPGRIIPAVLRAFADPHPGTHVRIIGEPIWPGRTETEYPACVQHEALINTAFAGRDITIICPYDIAGLSPHTVADALATHPLVCGAGQHYRFSSRYSPAAALARYNLPLNSTHETPALMVTDPADLTRIRRRIVEEASRAGLSRQRTFDLALIATELATNSLRHGGGTARIRLWQDHDHLVCEVHDNGHLADPLAGRRPPVPDQSDGRGLLMVNHLADLVRQHVTDHGTTIRAYLHLTTT